MTPRAPDPELTISELRVRPLELVPERPVQTAAGVLSSTPLVLIDLRTREGIVGRSYLRCYTPLALAATVRLLENLAEVLAGARVDPDGPRSPRRRARRSRSARIGGARTTWKQASRRGHAIT